MCSVSKLRHILLAIAIYQLQTFPVKARRPICGEIFKLRNEERIVGGSEVGLVYPEWTKEIFCGGALISPNFALTAAHCTLNLQAEDIAVMVGEHDVTIEGDGEVIVGVKRIIQHPDYHTTQYTNDLSLLNLKKPLLPSSTIGYICMPVGITNKNSGLPMEISGWGAVQEKGMNSPVLKRAIVFGIRNELCQKVYPKRRIHEKSKMCAVSDNMDACQGDSGGPLTAVRSGRKTLMGISSYGKGCARPGYPGIYARISTQLDWIFNNSDAKSVQRVQEYSTNGSSSPDSVEIKCPDNFLLVSFKFDENDEKDSTKYLFKCQETNSDLKPIIAKLLEDKKKVDSVDCSEVNGVLSAFKFSFDQTYQSLTYSYNCEEVSSSKLVNCTNHQTIKMDSSERITILPDLKMSVACDENKYLTKFHLKSELNQTWYNYRCCSVNYFGDSDIHPHEELAS